MHDPKIMQECSLQKQGSKTQNVVSAFCWLAQSLLPSKKESVILDTALF